MCGEAGGGYSDVGEMEQEVTEQNLNLHLSLLSLVTVWGPLPLGTI